MTVDSRLPLPFGTFIDRDAPVSFSFEGRSYSGFAGDCLASALAANGQLTLSRSFKYHRPRGILTMAGQDANSLVQLPSYPNVLADRLPIAPGLNAVAQNCSGSLDRDRNSVIGALSRFLPVGFYYKAFYRPRGAWAFWSRVFRRKAGLGMLDPQRSADRFDKQYGFCDVAVIGGGPAGMTAALAAADSGAEVWLVDENPQLGGSLNYSRPDVAGTMAAELRTTLAAKVEANSRIAVFRNAICNGLFEHNWLAVIQGQRLYKLRASDVILCTGSMEQPAVFRNNDLPGVMMGSAAQRLIHLYAVRPGQLAVVLAGNDEAYGVALDLLDTGTKLHLVADLREQPAFDDRARAVLARGVEIRTGHTVYEALAKSGRLHGVMLGRVASDGSCDATGEVLKCNLLCMSVGFMPAYQLAFHAGARLVYDGASSGFSLTALPDRCQAAGSLSGLWDLDDVLADGARAAVIASNSLTKAKLQTVPEARTSRHPLNHPWPIFPHPKGKDFVDFDEDVQVADIFNAVADGFDQVELVKRYSTCGMGPSQGRHSALAVARLVAKETGRQVSETTVTTARPPFAAERLGHCAGRAMYPARRSAMHKRHEEAGAQFLHAGTWYRPAFYGAASERLQAIDREVRNVRNNVGLIDVSTLGGIDVRGADAARFLDRIYTGNFTNQPVGRSRYAFMTNEAGIVIDDGVACRLHERHFYMTATTGGVEQVYQSMLKWNAQWRLDVDIANVTAAYAAVNVAGPMSREVLRAVCHDVGLEGKQFPYMGFREGRVGGIPARLIRVGFVGELGFEVHVPQHFGEALWDSLLAAGKSLGISPFGVEAQRVLRLEKGHIIVGQDTDAMSTPQELRMSWAMSRQKGFYVGGRTINVLGKQELKRLLTGFVVDDSGPLPREGHLVLRGADMIGRVTSCEYSPTLGKPIGLAFVPPQQAEPGQAIRIRSDRGAMITATTAQLPFYDPETRRQAAPA
jgi:sarcosine oxidase subunit alpha